MLGTDGWIFDRRGADLMLTMLSEYVTNPTAESHAPLDMTPWTPDFVRGIVAALSIDSKELSLNEKGGVISFRNTVADRHCLMPPQQGRTQLFRRNCTNEELVQILQDPRVHTGKGSKRKLDWNHVSPVPDPIVSTPHGQGFLADQEPDTDC